VEVYKLVNTQHFIDRAKDFGIALRLRDNSGLQVYWDYVGDVSQIKALRMVFRTEGLIANHHFKKVAKH
jgi:hypothetical protein